jgi:hypothetical protein
MERNSMIIYRSFYEAIKELPKENQADVWTAVYEYGLNGNKIDLQGISNTIFILISPQIEANYKKYLNGIKPKTKQNQSEKEAKPKQKKSKTEANVNDNDNENENVYRRFAHLSLSFQEYDKLAETWNEDQINTTLDEIENYKKNNQYKSLFLTAKKWLGKNFPNGKQTELSLDLQFTRNILAQLNEKDDPNKYRNND